MVQQLSLKGTREVRGRPPRRGAWQTESLVRPHEAGVNRRERATLPRHSLPNWGFAPPGLRGSAPARKSPRGGSASRTRPQVETRHLMYLVSVRDAAKSGLGGGGHRHLHALGASIMANVGGC